jgi:hypothetical protein
MPYYHALSHRERVGVRGSDQAYCPIRQPLILPFSHREEELIVSSGSLPVVSSASCLAGCIASSSISLVFVVHRMHGVYILILASRIN